jgi:hypothetical protein
VLSFPLPYRNSAIFIFEGSAILHSVQKLK